MKTRPQPFPGVSYYVFGLGFYQYSFKLSRIKSTHLVSNKNNISGPAAGLNVCAVWYPGKPKAYSSGEYSVPQKEK